jgi:hypothetical protein
MAWAYAITGRGKCGGKNWTAGTWTTDTTGGTLYPGPKYIAHFAMMPNDGATTVSCTYTQGTAGVTIACTSGIDGSWFCLAQ